MDFRSDSLSNMASPDEYLDSRPQNGQVCATLIPQPSFVVLCVSMLSADEREKLPAGFAEVSDSSKEISRHVLLT
jgi:hypothetical protein